MPTTTADHHEKHLRISVAMCTYNGEAFLAQQLESIARQTRQPDEMVVCDDRSTDNTLDLLNSFALTAGFPVRVFTNTNTLRPAQNFAQCIDRCEGDIIVLTDQDDFWFADRILNTEKAFQASPELTFVFSECPLIDASGADLGRSIYSSLPVSPKDRAILFEGSKLLPVLLRSGVLYGTTMAFRANLKPLILPLPDLWSHDEWIGLILSAAGPSARLEKPVTHYRQHAAQQVGTGDWTLQTHFGLAQKQSPDHYDSELRRFEYAVEAVQRHESLRETLLPVLNQKLAFLRDRKQVQTGGIQEIALFLRMVFSGEYAQFGSATRSPLKDLLMNFGLLHRKQ